MYCFDLWLSDFAFCTCNWSTNLQSTVYIPVGKDDEGSTSMTSGAGDARTDASSSLLNMSVVLTSASAAGW